MSFARIITTAIHEADIDEASFDDAIKSKGFKSRFDWFLRGAPASLQEAYNLRVGAEHVVAALGRRAA